MPPFWLKQNGGCALPPMHLTLLLALFPGMNQDLRGRHFADVTEVQQELLMALDSISIGGFLTMFPAVGALVSLHLVTGGVL